jgi:RNA polymerase sigma-70 factor, ECF subfamily
VPDAENSRRSAGGPDDTFLTLLKRLRGNEPDAWETLVKLYSPLVYRWCARGGIRGADADDVAQQVFQSVATHLADFRLDREGDTFRGWMRVITQNIIRHHYRRLSRRPKTCGSPTAWVMLQGIVDPSSETFHVDADVLESQHLRRRALEMIRLQFEERTWSMFWETFIKERSPGEVGAQMGVTAAAVRKAKSRVLHRLKNEFADLVDPEKSALGSL